MDTTNIPEILMSKRDYIECNFIFTLYLNPSLAEDYSQLKNGEDIITEDGMFYYGILNEMIRNGYTDMTDMSISSYCEDKKVIKEGYQKRGGWSSIQEIMNVVSEENIEAYANELMKSNILINLYQHGFNVIEKYDMLKDMTVLEISNYFEYLLADVCNGRTDKIQSENLSEGYDKYIEKWDKKPSLGFKVGPGALNYQLAGIHKKNLTLHLGGIGEGKTTTAISWYVLPAIETGNNICIIANEQDVDAWRQMIIATVMFNKLEGVTHGLNRHKMLYGGFTDEQKDRMKEAADWLAKQEGKITFVDVNDYDTNKIERLIKKYARLGIAYFIVDTFKPSNDSSDRAWGEFSETAKSLFSLSKRLDVAILCTAQLATSALNVKYLDLTCIGKSKAIAETAGTVIMFRPLNSYEKETIEVYNYENKMMKKTKLDASKDYIMVFTPKNRYGQTRPQIIMERNMDFNYYHEVGKYDCPFGFDTNKR